MNLFQFNLTIKAFEYFVTRREDARWQDFAAGKTTCTNVAVIRSKRLRSLEDVWKLIIQYLWCFHRKLAGKHWKGKNGTQLQNISFVMFVVLTYRYEITRNNFSGWSREIVQKIWKNTFSKCYARQEEWAFQGSVSNTRPLNEFFAAMHSWSLAMKRLKTNF